MVVLKVVIVAVAAVVVVVIAVYFMPGEMVLSYSFITFWNSEDKAVI